MADTTTQAGTAFTARERDVYELIYSGRATKAIARELRISVKTVETHRMRINRKLGTHSGREILLHRIIELGEDESSTDGERLRAIMSLARKAMAGAATDAAETLKRPRS
jgi:DNA-binding CsgD family transcriptional regulator